MPLYEYECESCHHRFERIQKYSDPLESVCPTCGGKVNKLFSSPAIQFKGTGWYITDYAKKPSADTGNSKSSGSSSSDSSSSSSSSDSSTAAAASTSDSQKTTSDSSKSSGDSGSGKKD